MLKKITIFSGDTLLSHSLIHNLYACVCTLLLRAHIRATLFELLVVHNAERILLMISFTDIDYAVLVRRCASGNPGLYYRVHHRSVLAGFESSVR